MREWGRGYLQPCLTDGLLRRGEGRKNCRRRGCADKARLRRDKEGAGEISCVCVYVCERAGVSGWLLLPCVVWWRLQWADTCVCEKGGKTSKIVCARSVVGRRTLISGSAAKQRYVSVRN